MELCGSSPEMALILASLALKAVRCRLSVPIRRKLTSAHLWGSWRHPGRMVGAEFWQPYLLRTGAEHKPAVQL
jgi:hypothetical protein